VHSPTMLSEARASSYADQRPRTPSPSRSHAPRMRIPILPVLAAPRGNVVSKM
jgi:hypothetical protein